MRLSGRGAEDHLLRVFSQLDEYSPGMRKRGSRKSKRASSLLRDFRKRASVWRGRFRCLKLRRGLGLFYVIEGRRLLVSGIFPLTMEPETLLRRLEDDDLGLRTHDAAPARGAVVAEPLRKIKEALEALPVTAFTCGTTKRIAQDTDRACHSVQAGWFVEMVRLER